MNAKNAYLFVAAGLFFTFLLMLISSPDIVCAKSYSSLRDCVVWMHAESNGSATVSWKKLYASDSTFNHIYFQGPDGKLLNRVDINPGDQGGSQTLTFSEGVGDYRLEIPGYFHRKAGIDAPEIVSMVIEPAKYHFSMYAPKKRLYFDVPQGTSSFTLCGKYHKGPSAVYLYDPRNNLKGILNLRDTNKTLRFDSLEIESPFPGAWHIKFKGTGKISFWVDGIPNFFAESPGDLFIPELREGTARFTATGRTGRMGLIGGYSVLPSRDIRIFGQIRYMGLKSLNYYVDHQWREPFNESYPTGGDNENPAVIAESGFNWEDQRIEFFRKHLDTQVSVLFSSKKSWLGIPLTSGKQKEFAEFVLAYLKHFNVDMPLGIRWLSPWDEPNLRSFTYDEYAGLVKEVATRIKDPKNPQAVRDTNVMAISSSGFMNTNSGRDRIGMDWAEKLYSAYDELVDGIAFDIWDKRDLIESWQFRNAVETAEEIMAKNDRDGNTNEQIVINQTSMSSGKSSSAYEVNTHFGALWIAGAICNAFSSGRLNAFHYFTTVDDERHMKGLIYSDKPPPGLPYQTAGQSYDLKPIGYAMAMINKNVLDEVIELDSDSLEVDALLTVSDDRLSAGLIVVNKFPRINSFKITAALPEDMQNRIWRVSGQFYDATMTAPAPIPEVSQMSVSDETFIFQKDLNPETVYAFSFKNNAP